MIRDFFLTDTIDTTLKRKYTSSRIFIEKNGSYSRNHQQLSCRKIVQKFKEEQNKIMQFHSHQESSDTNLSNLRYAKFAQEGS